MLDAFTVEDGCLFISLGFNLDLAVIHILNMLIYFKKMSCLQSNFNRWLKNSKTKR